MDEHDSYQRRRQTFLTVFLAGIVLIGLLFVFTILTGGFLLYVLLVVGVAGLVAGAHYLLWGRAYTEETAGEREELEAQERADDEGNWLDETRRPLNGRVHRATCARCSPVPSGSLRNCANADASLIFPSE